MARASIRRWNLLAVLGLVMSGLSLAPRVSADPAGFASECAYAPDGPDVLAVGVVDCLRFDSEMMGGKEPFSYYVPPACAPDTGKRCPVLYWLHGLGGTYQSTETDGLGPKGTTDAPWIRALTSGPNVDPRTVSDPWTLADTSTWVPRPALDMIIVAPHGQTLPGGNGPGANRSTGWLDFNPRYAKGGDAQRYNTPPPRSESMILDELIPYVEAHLPALGGRSGSVLGGLSYGSIGTGIIGLHHPDRFAALQMMSGGGFPWPQAGPVSGPAGVQVASPVQSPVYVASPGVQPYLDSTGAIPMIFVGSYGDGFTGDSVWTRYNSPPDLVGNGHATADGQQVLKLRITVNDGVPRRVEDAPDPFTPIAAGLELALSTTPSTFMHQEATRLGVAHDFLVGPGIHSHPYWKPFMRETLEALYARVQHSDGQGHVDPAPDRFDYRTIARDFSIWGWHLSVTRVPDEFLDLTAVSCSGLTLRGSGVVTITVPTSCGTGVNGSNVVTVDLGASLPVNEPHGVGSSTNWGHVAHIALTALVLG